MSTHYTRRDFLMHSSLLSAAALIPFLHAQDKSPVSPQIPSRDTLLKFNSDGTRRSFAGNTVICHLPVQCAMRDAMIELHDALAALPFHNKLGLTSIDSYHMTVFAGANDQDRMISGWPSYVARDASIEVCNHMVGERMEKARLACELPLRVRVDVPQTLAFPTACTLRLVPVDAAEQTKLRAVRDQLAEVYGFRSKDHDAYQFHMTMSYQMQPFTAQEQVEYRAILKTHVNRIVAAEPILELGNPEYCTFPDMFRFDPQKLLLCS